MANTITGIRIICSLLLLLPPIFSPVFYTLYIIAGLSDMLDGIIARKTKTVSEFGSKLDTIADFILVVVCFIKLLPVLNIETWMYIWIVIIAIIKVLNVVSGFIVQKRFIAVHTIMNKITGVCLFILPLTVKFIELRYSILVVCLIATFTAIQEGLFIRTKR